MKPPAHSSGSSSDLDAVLNRFEEAWRQGTPPRMEAFIPADASSTLLHELILIDLNYRWRLPGSPVSGRIDWSHGAAPPRPGGVHGWVLEDYLRRFPQLDPVERLSTELIGEEYRVRQRWGDHPGHDVYLTRFPAHAALLPNILRVIDAELAADRPIPVAVPLNGAAASPPSDQAIGPYLILERLGQGGTGQVFKARHQGLDRVVALKVIRPELLTDPEVVSRFYREMRLVSQLSSPHIVHAFDAGPIGVMHTLVMEYVEGIDLGRLVKQSGPLPIAQAADYIRQAALGLQHIYENQLVHRDIKPGNLLVARGQGLVASEGKRSPSSLATSASATSPSPLATVKILDLGLARWRPGTLDQTPTLQETETSSSSLTPAGAVMMGTPDYLAPEQALDFHAADIRSDLYSLGCTFYYLLTGQVPFPGGTLAQKLLNHQQTPAPSVQQLRPDVPAAYARLIARLLAKRPEDRFQSPAELVAALDALSGGRPTSDASQSPRRRKVAAAMGAAGLGVLFLAVVGFAVFKGNASGTQPSARAPAPPPPKPPPTYSFWADKVVPSRSAASDNTAVELGVKFRCDVPGVVTALRFYKSPANTGKHVGHLWDSTGQLLATAPFANETESGWQRANLSPPVPIKANVVYIASYHTETGNYAADHQYFAAKGVDRGPLHALPDGVAGGNGVFRQGPAGGFPTETFQSLNYYVDLVFEPSQPPTAP